jgi:hypothetical protein
MYATPGNSNKLEHETCRNIGRRCVQHKFYYIYSHRGCVIDWNSHLVWIHISLTFGITLRQISYRYRRSARQKKIIHVDNIETIVQNGSVPRNASVNSRWVCLTILTKLDRAASSETPPPPPFSKGKTIIQLSKLSVSPFILNCSKLYISVCCV